MKKDDKDALKGCGGCLGVCLIVFVIAYFWPDPPPEPHTPSKPQQTVSQQTRYQDNRPKATPNDKLEVSRIHREAKVLYEELQGFKFDSEFQRIGFSPGYRFSRWMLRVEKLRDQLKWPLGLFFFSDYVFVPMDLVMLAHEYQEGVFDSEYAKRMETTIEATF